MSRLRLPATVGSLAQALGGEPVGVGASDRMISGFAALDEAGPSDMAFFNNPVYKSDLEHTRAGVVILAREHVAWCTQPRLVITGDPRTYFARIVDACATGRVCKPGVDPSAIVATDAILAEDVHIGAGAVIGSGVHIGARTKILARAVVTDNCKVGADCWIHEGAVIGSEGFGFVVDEKVPVRVKHLGVVEIEDRVEVGANTCIDRGGLGNTVIGADTKIDNLVQVGHNVRIGAACLVCGSVAIGGSARIGDGCKIGGGSRIKDHVKITAGVDLQGGTNVLANINKRGTYGSAIPHMPALNLRRVWRALLKIGKG